MGKHCFLRVLPPACLLTEWEAFPVSPRVTKLQESEYIQKSQSKGLGLRHYNHSRVSPRGLWGGDRRLLTSSSLPVSGSLLSCSRSSGLPSSCASRSSKGRWRERTVTGKSRRSWPRLGYRRTSTSPGHGQCAGTSGQGHGAPQALTHLVSHTHQ